MLYLTNNYIITYDCDIYIYIYLKNYLFHSYNIDILKKEIKQN